MNVVRFSILALIITSLVACFDGGDQIPPQALGNAGNGTGGEQVTGGEQPPTTTGEAQTTGEADTTGGTGDVENTTGFEEEDFTLRIESIDPGVGATKGGNVISVFGNGFKDELTQVLFGQSLASDVFVISNERLTCTTPPGNPGLVDVTVSIPADEITARLEGAFRYKSDMLILGIEPNEGTVVGGEPVTISGSGFSQGNTSLLFGNKKAINVQVVDDSTIHATTPTGAGPGLVDVHVSNDQGQAELKGGFLYYEAPFVEFVTPGVGPVSGGTEVTLSGRGFEPKSVVRFGELEATKVTFVDSGTLLAVTPEVGAEGIVSVTVETQYGFGGLVEGFYYIGQEPAAGVMVVSVQPSSGTVDGGETVQVTAYGLIDAADTAVTFGGAAATVLSVDAVKHSIIVETPAGSAGGADVTVVTGNGENTLVNGYTYEVLLNVTAVNPLSGPVDGGTEITVFGSGFNNAAQVRVGALPCSAVTVVNEKTIECLAPPGSPGGADVSVLQGTDVATLVDGYFYETGSIELFIVDPNTGSHAGGTYVRLLGSGFTAPATVTFDGNQATHVKVVNSTLITCKTPPGSVGTIDVVVQSDGVETALTDSFTYFDPVALFGGTWGPEVEGAVNVTVLDGGNGSPISDAFVILKVDPDTPYQGFTNGNGQITFSGPDVLGEQMVSASKDGYASQSVIEFDATNITIYMIPTPPPSSGPPPPGASLTGSVSGLGKYVVVPPGNCFSKGPQPGGQCWSCGEDSQCETALAPNCTQIADTGQFCTRSCLADSDCDQGYACLNVSGTGEAQCVPMPGAKQARCYFTMGPQLPQSQDPFIVAPDGTFSIPSRLGEVAVICLGGVVNLDNPDNESNFTAYAFGVKRHVNVVPGLNDVGDVALNHPLTRDIQIRLDDPPYDPVIGPNVSIVQVYWDFGSEGVFFHPNFFDGQFMFDNDNVTHTIERQPAAFTGDVYDVTFWILAGAISYGMDPANPNNTDPQSLTVLRNLKDIETDRTYSLAAGQWESVKSGVTKTVFALHGFEANNLWGVGADGAILHYGGLGWGQQASPVVENLYGVWGAVEDDVWAVGAGGTVLRFDGAVWEEDAIPGAFSDLRGIWGTSANDIFVAGGSYSGAWHYDGTTWTKMTVPGADLRDIHGSSSDSVWAVGRYGSIRYWNGTNWSVQSAGTTKDLFSVHAVSADEAYAVGAAGTLLRWDGQAWSTMASPVSRAMRAVWANGPMDVYAVGDGSTLLHYDGNEWADQTLPSKVSYASLLAIWGDPATGNGQALGTSEVLMGPLLQVPQDQNPADGGVMQDYFVSFSAKPGVPAKYNMVDVFIPTPFGDVPVWGIVTDGNIWEFDLPDFANIEGTPGIAPGGYGLRILRGYNDDFDIDNYDNSDFNPRSWSMDTIFFSK